MRIGIYTTWNHQCGIAEYTKQLASAIKKADPTTKIVLLVNKPTGTQYDTLFPPSTDYEVVECWEWYGRTNKCSEDKVDFEQFDVVHIQYESFLWHQSYFNDLMRSKCPVLVTYHSSCVTPGFLFTGAPCITHSRSFYNMLGQVKKKSYLPMPVHDDIVPMALSEKKLQIASFGLHRNDDAFCQEASRQLKDLFGLDVPFVTSYGNAKWIPSAELNDFLNSSRYIALIYPRVDAEVSSSAVGRALGTGSVVLTSDTKWFDWVRSEVKMMDNATMMAWVIAAYEGVHGAELREALLADWANVSQRAIDKYGLSKVAQWHLNLYRNLAGV